MLDAVIHCPRCGAKSRAAMPNDACLHFYRCPVCGELLAPKPGDCCVFCSYSDQLCPPKQATTARDRAAPADRVSDDGQPDGVA